MSKISFDTTWVMFDVDNTLYDFSGACGIDPHAVATYDDIPRLCGDRWDELHHDAIHESTMVKRGLYDGAQEAIRKLRADGISVLAFTKRPEFSIAGSARALRSLELEFDMFLGGQNVEKVEVCRELGINIVVDDAPFTIEAAHERGLTTMSMWHPYVEPFTETHGTVTFHNWSDGYEAVSSAAAVPAR